MMSVSKIEFLDDEAMEKIAAVLNKEEQKKHLMATCDNKKDASIMAKQLKLQGYNASIVESNGKFNVMAGVREHVLYDEAMKSGCFKKLAKNTFAFERKANETLGYEDYKFDEGSIWTVIQDENGVEYLVKEVEDSDEDKIVRTKAAALEKHQLIDSKNMSRAIEAFYGLVNKELLLDLAPMSNTLVQMLNDKLDKTVQAELDGNKFISTPGYKEIVKEHVVKNLHNLHGRTQVAALISKFNKDYIATTVGKAR